MSYGMSYWFQDELLQPPVWAIWKNIRRRHTEPLKRYIDRFSLRMHGHSWGAAEFEPACFDRSRMVSAHAADFVWERRVWNNVRGNRDALPSYTVKGIECYWILLLIWLAITSHLPLTTLSSIHSFFISPTGFDRAETGLVSWAGVQEQIKR